MFDETYFKTNTYEKVSFGRFSQYWWSNRFYAILARRYARRGGRMLEIGCGLGHLAGQLSGYFRAYAMDVNLWALEQARGTQAGVNFLHAGAERVPFEKESFDLVIIKHVVEHLEDPILAIREIGRLLAPGGVLILSTPNLDSLLKPYKGERWIGYQDPTHISLQPPAVWKDWIERDAGLKIIKSFSDGFWDVPYLPVIPSALQKLTFGVPGGVQAMTGVVFLPLRWGESIMVIARKL
jgi:SAM-dependent methyltransferase